MDGHHEPAHGADALRRMLRTFAPDARDPRLLRWTSDLDAEDGRGATVAVLDSGVRPRQPAFRGGDVRTRDFTGMGTADPDGHGTACAALLAARGEGGMVGLVPRGRLLVGRVRPGPTGPASERALAQAIEWAVCEGADVLAMPLGRVGDTPRVARAIGRALDAGAAVFAAAGNYGPDVLLFPAALPGVVAVTGAGPEGVPLGWCSRAPSIGCIAPGSAVPSVGPWGPTLVHGSSPATCLAAGVAALALARVRRGSLVA